MEIAKQIVQQIKQRNQFETDRMQILYGIDYGIDYMISAWRQNMIDYLCRYDGTMLELSLDSSDESDSEKTEICYDSDGEVDDSNYLGRVKQGVALYGPIEEDYIQREAEEACDSINLGRFSKNALPDKCVAILTEHLYDPEPNYNSAEGPAIAFVTRLLEFRTPHDFQWHPSMAVNCTGVVIGERKVDVLKVLTCTRFSTIHLEDESWMPCLDGETTEECMSDATTEDEF